MNQKLQALIEHTGITMSVEEGAPPSTVFPGFYGRTVTLTRTDGEDVFTLVMPFYTQHHEPLSPAFVLNCGLDDAASIENARSFYEWAEEKLYDWEEDEETTRTIYEKSEKLAQDLRVFLGEYYETFLWG